MLYYNSIADCLPDGETGMDACFCGLGVGCGLVTSLIRTQLQPRQLDSPDIV